MDEVLREKIRSEIRECKANGENPVLIFDKLLVKGADPSELRQMIMDSSERKMDVDQHDLGKSNLSAPEKKKYEIPKLKFGISKKTKIILIILVILGLIIIVLNSIELTIDISEDSSKVVEDGIEIPDGSYYGQIDFTKKVNKSMITDLFIDNEIILKENKTKTEKYVGYVFDFEVVDEMNISLKVRDYIDNEDTKSNYESEFIAYSVNKEGLTHAPKNINAYTREESRAFFEIGDDKFVYFVYEDNFFYKAEAKFYGSIDKGIIKKNVYYIGNRAKAFGREANS